MKIICAYFLACLGGNSSPCSADLNKILSSVGIELDEEKLKLFMSQVDGKSIDQIIASGRQKLESIPVGGGGALVAKEEKKVDELAGSGKSKFVVTPYLDAMATHVVTEAPNVYDDLFVTPLVQIFAITIHSSDHSSWTRGVKLHGKITVFEEDKEAFTIFYNRRNNPVSIHLGQPLMLTGDSTIIPFGCVTLKVQLYNACYSNTVANGCITLAKTNKCEDWLEDYQVKLVPGSEGPLFAKVHYSIFPYALQATVKVLFFNKNDHLDLLTCNQVYCYEDGYDERMESHDVQDLNTTYEENDTFAAATLHGVVSTYKSGVTGSNDSKMNITTSSLLFSNSLEDSVSVKSRGLIKLSRSMVVVPAYSSLVLDVAFYDADGRLIVSGVVKFKPEDSCLYKKDIIGNDGSRIRLQVGWGNAYSRYFHFSGSSGFSPLTINDNRSAPLIELFSVVVYSNDDTPFNFYGNVIVDDGEEYYIFDKDKSCPQECPKLGSLIILEGPSRSFVTFDDLTITVDLKEHISKAVVSSGHVWFRYVDFNKVANKRMCSVVRGERGFAALHYSIFPDGVSAHVGVKVYSKHLSSTIKGKIYARYVIHDEPSISYQEKLFSSILFYDVDAGVPFDTYGSALPLVRSLVTMPRDYYLFIEADLSLDGKLLQGVAKIRCKSDEPKQIGEGDLYLEVCVKFK